MCFQASAIVADGLNRAALHGLFALLFFLFVFGLFAHVGVAAVLVAGKVLGSRFAAEITVNALVIDVKLACDVLRIFVCDISHRIQLLKLREFWERPVK